MQICASGKRILAWFLATCSPKCLNLSLIQSFEVILLQLSGIASFAFSLPLLLLLRFTDGLLRYTDPSEDITSSLSCRIRIPFVSPFEVV